MSAPAHRRGWLRRHWLATAVVGLAAAVTAAIAVLLAWHPAPAELVLRGSATAQGEAAGRAQRWALRVLVRRYLHPVICGGQPAVIAQREATAVQLLDAWPAAYRDELAAMSQASGVPLPSLAYANLFLDQGNARAGCRSLVTWEDGHLRHGHNLDWENLGGVGRWCVVVTRRFPDDGRLRTVSIGFPGIIGALDIANEAGLALSFNQLGFGRGTAGEPVFLSLRRIAEQCRTWDEARAAVLALPPGMPFIITLSAAREGRAAVFERLREEIVERPLSGGYVCAANVAQTAGRAPSLVEQTVAAQPRATVAELQALLGHPNVMLSANLYSVVFDFQANRLHVASGKVPAATSGYRELELFPATP